MNADDRARIIFSSGTTGTPKAIYFTAHDLELRNQAYIARIAPSDWSRLLCSVGISTNFGFSFTIASLWMGRFVYIPANSKGALYLISIYKADNCVMSPLQLTGLVDEFVKAPSNIFSLKAIHVGCSLLMQSMIQRVRTNLCPNVICAYGSTEARTVAYAPAERLPAVDGAVGFIAPWIQIELCDNNGNRVPESTIGAIRIKAEGQGRTLKYGSSEENEKDDGWFYPGDFGYISNDGCLIIQGRSSELINSGGVKVAPDVIDDVFKKHPAVQDVGGVESQPGKATFIN